MQSFFYEIWSNIWTLNGVQIKGQAITYIQANFCNSMVDMDLFFLQICAMQLPPDMLLLSSIESFGVSEWLGMCLLKKQEEKVQHSMMSGLLTFLATIASSRTNLGNDDRTQSILEISALLATGDRTHSQLLELMPERSSNSHARNFEDYLSELSIFKKPKTGSENLEQGLFIPVADVWEQHYDPLHVLLRAVQRRDFQNSMNRFKEYVKQARKMPKSGDLWPPFRLPGPASPSYTNPSCILQSRILHAIILSILYRAVHFVKDNDNDDDKEDYAHIMSLAIFLLEMAVVNDASRDTEMESSNSIMSSTSNETPELLYVFPSNSLGENLRHHVNYISRTSSVPQNSPANYNSSTFDSDYDWDVSDNDPFSAIMIDNPDLYNRRLDVAIPQDLSVVREQAIVLHQDSIEQGVEAINVLPTLTFADASDDTAIVEYVPGQHLALAPAVPPPIESSSMHVAIRNLDLAVALSNEADTSRSVNLMFPQSNLGSMLPFQRVQPVAVPNRNTDMVALNANGARNRSVTPFKAKSSECSGSNDSDSGTMIINESILSLLLKLHSKLSGQLDSFCPEEEVDGDGDATMRDDSDAGPSSSWNASQSNQNDESRIGDGPYFIGNLLRKIAKSDTRNARAINDIRLRLWPNQREKETREKEERSKRVRDRQRRLMEEFANKQKKFMEQANAENMDCCDDDDNDEGGAAEEMVREKEYTCIICNRTTPSNESNPVCLIVLRESTGVLGHRRLHGEALKLPLSDSDIQPQECSRIANTFSFRTNLLTQKFGHESWYLSNNNSFTTGVYVQSCGHYVHSKCHTKYMKTLLSSPPPSELNLNVRVGEFLCPVCRQLSNSVLPLSSQIEKPAPVVRHQRSYETLLNDLTTLIKDNERSPVS